MIVRPVFACRIIVACAILPNFLGKDNDKYDFDTIVDNVQVSQTKDSLNLNGLEFRLLLIILVK